METIISIFKEWNAFYQIVIMLVTTFAVSTFIVQVLSAIEKFFNSTIPVLVRGWPPICKDCTDLLEEDEETDEDDKK
jgi:hypothetical protein